MKKLIIASLLLLLSACDRSPDEKLNKALQSIKSWSATASLVGAKWQQGEVPDDYAQQTLAKSQQEITQETQDITIPTTLQQPVQQMQQTLGKMEKAVDQDNRKAIAPLLQTLSKEQQQIDKIAAARGQQP